MENNNINNTYKVKIKASVLLTKFKHKEDRINFCRERSNTFHITYRLLFS
jgi:hypothetical protein